MATISFNIPNDKLSRIVAAMVGRHPIPQIPDLNQPIPDDGEPIMIPEFTKAQWAKEAVRRWVIREVWEWERQEAVRAAKQGMTIDVALLT
jgi:hypothetical protein